MEHVTTDWVPEKVEGALDNTYRRQIMQILCTANTVITKETLTGELSGVDTKYTGDGTGALLRHRHLPILADAGLITYIETPKQTRIEVADTTKVRTFLHRVLALDSRQSPSTFA